MEEWVKVGSAPNETLALMMRGVLEDAGIPVALGRPSGFDMVLDELLLGCGSQEVLVPRDRAEEARQTLEDTTGTGL